MFSLRDNLLVTAGARAAYMDGMTETISLPGGIEGEDVLAEFIVDMVDQYLYANAIAIGVEPFDIYIEKALINKFGGNS